MPVSVRMPVTVARVGARLLMARVVARLPLPVRVRVRVRVPVRVLRLRLGLVVLLVDHVVQHVRHRFEGEGAEAEELVEVRARMLRLDHLGNGVDGVERLAHPRLLLRGDEVDLVQQDLVCERNLVDSLVDDARRAHVVQVLLDVFGVYHAQDRVDSVLGAHLGLVVEGVGDGCRIRHPGRLDNHRIVLLLPLRESDERLHQVTAHRAADAAVVHRDHVLLRLELVLDERGVDVEGAKLVFDDRDLLAVLLFEDVVDERRLPGAEEARDERDGRLLGVGQHLGLVVLLLLLSLLPVLRQGHPGRERSPPAAQHVRLPSPAHKLHRLRLGRGSKRERREPDRHGDQERDRRDPGQVARLPGCPLSPREQHASLLL
mmetsp:Transcript_7860/g.19089  ORF Transcript_7860/g.19089 Transcript_7860/m.19089 type:complete len:374 (+) Transcript_7860:431-1552(+)